MSESVSQSTKKPCSKHASGSSTIAIASLSILASACGGAPYNISSSSDRDAMKIDIENALTKNDCTTAITLSTQLYQSAYSDNEARMLYASAQGCNIGVNLYDNIDSLANLSTTNPLSTFVKMFPSTTSDSRLASTAYAQDALQAILNPGAVIANANETYSTSYNPGSVLTQDRTTDSNTYMMFIGMAGIGTALNRFGNPTASGGKGTALTWTSLASVKADTTGNACNLASALLNFLDGANSAINYLASGTAGNLNSVLSVLSTPIQLAVTNQCVNTDHFTAAQCSAAYTRLRYRGACQEQDAAASVAAGVIGAINGVWQ